MIHNSGIFSQERPLEVFSSFYCFPPIVSEEGKPGVGKTGEQHVCLHISSCRQMPGVNSVSLRTIGT